MNMVLIGFMGAGKTVVGQLLARELGLNFLDTDELIEKTAGRKISEIFRADGEAGFRDLETEVLKTLQAYDNFVLATGGGMVLREENVASLKEIGPIIYLSADAETIYSRVKNETHRPLLQVADPLTEIVKRLESRKPYYEKAADVKIETAGRWPEQIKAEVVKWLKSKSS